MDQVKIGSTHLTGCLMALLGSSGKWFLPEPGFQEAIDAAKLLQIRQELEDTGFVELDFDGKLHPTAEFARLAYNITHARNALCWKKENRQRIYIRGPVDDLLLTCERDIWSMELSRPSGVLFWMRDLVQNGSGGMLKAMNGAGEASREVFPEMEADPAEAVSDLLDIYFGGGSGDA